MKVTKVLILGYYNRYNLGDDMFEYVFVNYFSSKLPNIELVIKNTDDIEEIEDDVSLVICGGGDMINDYFLKKIKKLVGEKRKTIPIYAWGIGFPYQGLIDNGGIDVFDYVIHRNKCDQQRLLLKYGSSRVKYFPDLGFMLPEYSRKEIKSEELFRVKHDKGKKIGVFLSKTIYHKNNPDVYEKILDNLAYFLVKIAKIKKQKKFLGIVTTNCCRKETDYEYKIYLLASCTNESNQMENDRLVNMDLYQKICKYGDYTNIHLIDQRIDIDEVIPLFENFYMTICLRFHAHIFSILSNVPILSVYSSRKVENLLESNDLLEYSHKMEIDAEKMYPTKVDCWKLYQLFMKINNEYKEYKEKITLINQSNQFEMNKCKNYFKNLILSPIKYYGQDSPAFETKAIEITNNIAYRIVDLYDFAKLNLVERQEYSNKIAHIEKDRSLSLFNYLKEMNVLTDQTDQTDQDNDNKKQKISQFLTEFISFTLTGMRISDFNYGLQEQLLNSDYHLFESVKWILNMYYESRTYDNILSNKVKMSYRKFNFRFFQHDDLKGFHRSGWSYVVGALQLFHNPEGPIFDSFLDKTFGWNYDFYTQIGVLPFKDKWTGVFHHTPNESYSINNMVEIFTKPNFIESLKECVGLYVLSEYLQQWLINKLCEVEYPDIPVEVLIHPTEFVDNKFTMEKFLNNKDKKVIQIGAWMRNSYAIYQISKPKYLNKCALKGRNMENYFPTEQYLEELKEAIYKIGGGKEPEEYGGNTRYGRPCRPHGPVCRPGECFCNKYMIGLYQMIIEKNRSVKVIERLDNDKYDEILSENVVFLQLVDASAVNTVIECIVRNTPIIINRLPALEEYLGKAYPLFYDTIEEAECMLNDIEQINCGYLYLFYQNKTKFTIDNCVRDFISGNIFNLF